MGCNGCGRSRTLIKRRRISAIVEGFGKVVADKVLGKKPGKITLARILRCKECEHRTFLNVAQWGEGAVKKDILPISHEPKPGDTLWCSICKCCIAAKARAKDEHCPLDKW